MNAQTDNELLKDYAESRSETAFAELVRRHVDLVYSAAMRMVGESHAAKDVTQAVFVALAQNAPELANHPVLSGWLHCTARNLAAKNIRGEIRRHSREQEAAAMNEILSAKTEPTWEEIAPHLDAALGELNPAERDAVMLRYFEKKSAPEMAGILGVSTDAAQKRVNRAVERLREHFAKRGVTVGASGLVLVVTANAVQAAPAGLAIAISTTAALGVTTIATTAATTTATTITKAILMTTFQKVIVTASIAAAVGAGIYGIREAQQASNSRTQLQNLQKQQAPLTAQIQQLTGERDAAKTQIAALRDDNERLKRNVADLPKLRGDAARLRQSEQELSQLKANTNSGISFADVMSRLMDDPEQKAAMLNEEKKTIKKTHAALFKQLNLTQDQEEKLINLLAEKEVVGMNTGMALLTGGPATSDLQSGIATALKKFDDDTEGLLGADGFKQFQDFETTLPDREQLDEFKQKIKKMPLAAEQEKQLLDVMVQERAKTSSSAVTERTKWKVDFDAERQNLDAQGEINQQVLSRATAFLSQEQLVALKKYQAEKLASDKKEFEMFQRLFNGPAQSKEAAK